MSQSARHGAGKYDWRKVAEEYHNQYLDVLKIVATQANSRGK
jgi:hypothetical protein